MKKLLSFIVAFNLYAAFPNYYYKIKNINKQKKAFVNILFPLIKKENTKILHLRKKIIEIFNDPFFLLNKKDLIFLAKTAKKYNIRNITDKKNFLIKINTVPPSLTLAQAAIESGWGKSRFTRLANNIFGHWEYSSDGIQPKSNYNNIDINYSLKIFPSIEDSVKAYLLNLNRNPAYKNFRKKRFEFKKNDKFFTGITAASTLKYYSQLRSKYINRLKALIKYNNWLKFDKINLRRKNAKLY